MKTHTRTLAVIAFSGLMAAHAFADNSALLDAVKQKNHENVKSLLRSGADPNASDDQGLTALHLACITADYGIAELLLDFGANVNALAGSELEGFTPLVSASGSVASDSAAESTVSLLLKRGADPNPGGNGMSPLAFAMLRGHSGAVSELKENGAILKTGEPEYKFLAQQKLAQSMKTLIHKAVTGQVDETEFRESAANAADSYSNSMKENGATVTEEEKSQFLEANLEKFRALNGRN